MLSGVDQFFTLGSLSTLAGAAGATLMISNALWLAFGVRPHLTGFFAAQIICHGLIWIAAKSAPVEHAIGFVNACLVSVTAAGGANLTGGANLADPAAGKRRGADARATRRFWVRWI